MMRWRRKGAFTLVELLLVIAVILILLALLMPALETMLAHARSVKCINNLRQLGQAWRWYSQDQNGFLPAYGWPCSGTCCGDSWPVKLSKYSSGTFQNLLLCPEATQVGPRDTHAALDGCGFTISYCVNNRALDDEYHGGSYVNMSTITKFAKLPVFMDGNWVDVWPGYPIPYSYPVSGWDPVAGNVNESNFGRIYMWRHPGNSINMVFGDGHAQNVKLPELWNFTWGPNWPQ